MRNVLFSWPAKICSKCLGCTLLIYPRREKISATHPHTLPLAARTAVMTKGHVVGTHFHLLSAKQFPPLWKNIILIYVSLPDKLIWSDALLPLFIRRAPGDGTPPIPTPATELAGQEGVVGVQHGCGCHLPLSCNG